MPDPTLSLTIAGLDGPLGHRVYITLRNSILNMALEPGTVLRKGILCEQLGVSRSPVAERRWASCRRMGWWTSFRNRRHGCRSFH